MQAKMTKRAVDGTLPSDKDVFLWDTEVKGFGLKVTPAGGKVYVLAYRIGGRAAQKKRYTIGKHGSPWTPDQARDEAKRLLALIAQGIEPSADKAQRERKALTITDLSARYLGEYVTIQNKPSTVREFTRLIDKVILPKLGKVRVADLSRTHVHQFHYDLRTTPRQANHALSVLSKMLNLAEVWEMRPDGSNPCRHIKRFKEVKRERFLSEAELGQLGTVLAEIEREGIESPSYIAAVRLLVLTGCRLGEVLALRWDDVNLDAGVLCIRDAKAGARAHAIGALSMAFLTELPRCDSPFIIDGRSPDEPMKAYMLEKFWQRIRTRAGLNDARLHDLRHTVGTYAGQTGANAFLVRDKLGHKTLAMTGRYVNRDANPLRILSDQVEQRIHAAMQGGAVGAVVPLKRPA
jgi:integrase